MSATATVTGVGAMMLLTAAAFWWLARPLPRDEPCLHPGAVPNGDITPDVARTVLQYHDRCPRGCPTRHMARDVLLAIDRRAADSAQSRIGRSLEPIRNPIISQ